MKQQSFEAQREQVWRDFDTAVRSARRGYQLQGADVANFVSEYQKIARDLSVAKSRGYSRRLIGYLNDLVVRGHNLVYARRSGFLADFVEFVTGGFSRSVRAAWPFVAVSALLFMGSLCLMAVVVVKVPEWIYTVMPADQTSQLEGMYDPNARVLGRERASDGDFAMFGFYIMNNIGIAFQVFASGLLLGIGSAFYLVSNGVYIGAAAAHMINVGFTDTFFSFVVGHGSFELTGIVLSGAAGLMIGYALIAPGRQRRVDALRRASRQAVRIVLGAALMLVFAAFVEAFWSSTMTIAPALKYFIGAVLWLVVLLYLVGAGRRPGVDGGS